jgi:hypothetical protein
MLNFEENKRKEAVLVSVLVGVGRLLVGCLGRLGPLQDIQLCVDTC